MPRQPTHRNEQTGSPGADRMQSNVRDLIVYVTQTLARVQLTHGVGVRRVQMQDKDYALTSADLEGAFIVISGPLSAARTITTPRATDRSGYGRWFYNFTGQDLTFVNADGSTLLTAAALVGLIVTSADGPELWT